jgi:broad specificity phosphatase PhoE
MTLTLHLIRHGKASTQHWLTDPDDVRERSEPGYDALDRVGIEQARLLGAALAQRRARFDKVFRGPLERHKETLGNMRLGALQQGAHWPPEEEREDLREVALDRLMRSALPQLVVSHETIRTLWSQAVSEGAAKTMGESSALPRIVSYIAAEWRAGRMSSPDVEDWGAFRARAASALHGILEASGEAEHVAVITSLGVISCMLDVVSSLPKSAAAQVPFQWLSTASISRVGWDGNAWAVQMANDVDHLRDRPGLLTLL